MNPIGIIREFPIQIALFVFVLLFSLGAFAGKLFYDDRNIMSATIVGLGLLFLGLFWWLI